MAKGNQYSDLTQVQYGDWKDSFIFIQAADTQFGLIDNYRDKSPENQRVWSEEIKLTRLAFEKVKALTPKPKFFIICGDLIDAFPETLNRDAQVKDLKEVFGALDIEIPLICVCGNHDIGNSPTQESLQKYRDDFGDDYFSFWVGGVFFIVINSQYYEDSSKVAYEETQHAEWLDKQLAAIKSNQCTHAVVFQHIPWFINDANEEDQYFNIGKKKRLHMLSKFHDAGVRHVFCGHYHRNAGGRFKNLEVITTSAIGCQLGDDESGMRIVKVMKEKIEHKYYKLDETFPKVINMDENLP